MRVLRCSVAALVPVLVLAAVAALAWAQRIALAERWLVSRAEARGLAPVSLRVAALDPRGIAVEAISIGAPDLAVERLEAAWSWQSLRAGRFVSLRVRGVDLRGRLDEQGLSLGALDALFEPATATAGAFVLPAPAIALDEARVRLQTARGLASGSFAGALREEGKGVEGAFSLDLAGAGVTARGRLDLGGTLSAPSFRVRLDPLASGELSLRLDLRGRATQEGVIAIESGVLRVADGTLRIGPTTLDPRSPRSALVIRAEDLDLAALLALVNIEGLAATGRVGGELPLLRENGRIRVDAGLLRATGAGTIRYAASESVRELALSRPSDLGLAIAAFSDFRYESLEARVDGDLAGALAIRLHVKGANPQFEDGQPVALNLNLESQLADLVRAGLASYRVPEQIEKRVRERSTTEDP